MKGYTLKVTDDAVEVVECEVVLRTPDDKEAYRTVSQARSTAKLILRERAHRMEREARELREEAQRIKQSVGRV